MTDVSSSSDADPKPHRGYTMQEQIACIRRELAMRERVYPKWVQAGRMEAEKADHEINCMQAVHDTLCAKDGK
jgi:hypothetical protein